MVGQTISNRYAWTTSWPIWIATAASVNEAARRSASSTPPASSTGCAGRPRPSSSGCRGGSGLSCQCAVPRFFQVEAGDHVRVVLAAAALAVVCHRFQGPFEDILSINEGLRPDWSSDPLELDREPCIRAFVVFVEELVIDGNKVCLSC